MTLLIVSRSAESESVIELHGRLSDAEIGEFRGACASRPLPLRIDLSNLSGATSEGVVALREAQARGARLTAASPYVELLLRAADRGGGRQGQGSGARG